MTSASTSFLLVVSDLSNEKLYCQEKFDNLRELQAEIDMWVDDVSFVVNVYEILREITVVKKTTFAVEEK